jgi:hypothetical protein
VVSPQQSHSIFISNLQGDQQQKCFNTVSTSIDVIAHEDIVGVRREAPYFEELEQVIELAMDIAADGDWGANLDEIRLLTQDLLGLIA